MSLFDNIASAIENPEQIASSEQLTGILTSVKKLSNNTTSNPEAVKSAMSVVGQHVRSSLQEKRNGEDLSEVQSLVNQFSGTQPNLQAVENLFDPSQQDNLIQEIEAKTGLSGAEVEKALPSMVPLVLEVLQTGASNNNPQMANAVLSSFLDADGDGDVDIQDAINMASSYLQGKSGLWQKLAMFLAKLFNRG